jgi:protein transport protein SEC24
VKDCLNSSRSELRLAMGMEGDWTPTPPPPPPQQQASASFSGGLPQQNYGSTGQPMVPGMNQGLQGPPRGPPMGNSSSGLRAGPPLGPPGQFMAPGINQGLQGPSRAPMDNSSGPQGLPGFRAPALAVPPSANQFPGGPRGNVLGNNGPQGVPGHGPPGQQPSQPFLGQPPAFRPPFPSGPPNAGPPGVRPTFANSAPSVAAPGRGRGVAPPGRFGPPQQQVGGPGGPPSNFAGRGVQQQPGPSSVPPPGNAGFRGPPVGPPGGPPTAASAGPNYSQLATSQPTTMSAPPFPGAPPTAGLIPTSGAFPSPNLGPRGRPPGPPPIQLGGQPPSRSSVPPYGPENVPLSTQLQNLSVNQPMQGVVSGAPPAFGPPTGSVSNAGAPPPWQQPGQGGAQGPPRRIYPDTLSGPPTGSQGPASYPQQYTAPGPPRISQPNSPLTQNPSSGTSRIDPNQIPRPLPGATVTEFETRVNGQANLPPSASSSFIVRDTGNCSPRLMRATLNQIPCSGDLLGTSGMPLAVMVQPFALPHPSEEPIRVVDFGESGPVRCSRCKGYINHFMKFIDQGRRFTCNLCGFTNETPRDYHCNLGPDGRRRDADQRPELSRGTVEFVATKEYLVRPPMLAVYYFLIDVSQTAVQTGAVAAACSAIKRALADLPVSFFCRKRITFRCLCVEMKRMLSKLMV